MADKERVLKEKVEHSGLFDFAGFYEFSHSWLKEEGYGVVEEKYNEKVSGNARDITIEWAAIRSMSDYFKIEVKLKYEVTGLVDVEAEIDGKKKKMHKGRIAIELTGNLIKDPESKWDTTPLYRFMRDFYNKYIIPGKVEDMQEKVKSDIRELKEQQKAYLALTGRR